MHSEAPHAQGLRCRRDFSEAFIAVFRGSIIPACCGEDPEVIQTASGGSGLKMNPDGGGAPRRKTWDRGGSAPAPRETEGRNEALADDGVDLLPILTFLTHCKDGAWAFFFER